MQSVLDISPRTNLCALIGNPVGHSLSPAMHNRAFAELGLDYVYLAFRTEDAGGAIEGFRALEQFKGLSVTIPHKLSVIPHLDHIDAVDRRIGSINTVVKQPDGTLRGLGTDGPGARQALLDAGVTLQGAKVVILGSGGAARAIAFDLLFHAGLSSLAILGVDEQERRRLRRDLNEENLLPVEEGDLGETSLASRLEGKTVLIQATPVGMHPKTTETVLSAHLLRSDHSVMDIVYNPLETRLLREANAKGATTISGVDMFVNQAVLQFETWTGQKAPKEVMKKVVMEALVPGYNPVSTLPRPST